jgi:hypothetical protein
MPSGTGRQQNEKCPMFCILCPKKTKKAKTKNKNSAPQKGGCGAELELISVGGLWPGKKSCFSAAGAFWV